MFKSPIILCFLLLCCANTKPSRVSASLPADAGVSTVGTINREAENLRDWVTTPLAKAFLATAAELPSISTRVVYLTPDKTHAYSKTQAETLPEKERTALVRKDLDEEYYYTTRYGTPNSYVRPLELLAQNGFDSLESKKVLDFGYGYVGHLRMFALLGADAHGVEVDPILPVLYGEPGDTGSIQSRSGRKGRVTLHSGKFPFDATIKTAIGTGYDLFISKNVLKIGFVHPSRAVDPKRTLQLGVDDETYVRAVWDLLKPGGKVLIYNIYPVQNVPPKEWITWAEGKTAFAKEIWEKVGFHTVQYDLDDSAAMREMAHRVGWDNDPEDPMNLKDVFAVYSLLVKPDGK